MEEDTLKEEGIKTEFPVLFDRDELHENFIAAIEIKAKDVIRLNLYEIERNFTEDDVKNYYVKIQDDRSFSPYFEATIKRISRFQKQEITIELLRKFYDNEELESVEQVRALIAESIVKEHEKLSTRILVSEVKTRILEENQFDLPVEFLLRSFEAQQANNQENYDIEFDDYLQKIKETAIINDLVSRFNISISKTELDHYLFNVFRHYFPSQTEKSFTTWMTLISKSQKHSLMFYNQLLELKAFEEAAKVVKTTTKQITIEEANEILKKSKYEDVEDSKSLNEAEEEAITWSENTLLQNNPDFENSTDVE
ncbi:MAG: hypothetical protein HC892_23515 [Saprospiraceae bacterium]|nr:hypothetical protein [Saprospiraceae bacterium]